MAATNLPGSISLNPHAFAVIILGNVVELVIWIVWIICVSGLRRGLDFGGKFFSGAGIVAAFQADYGVLG